MGKREKGIDTIYFGVDESNHGRYPEFFAIVSSRIKEDSTIVMEKKIRGPTILESLTPYSKREFRSSVVDKGHYEFYGTRGLITRIVPQMVAAFDLKGENIEVLVDGELQSRIISDLAKNLRQLDVGSVKVSQHPKGKGKKSETLRIISYADALAGYLYQRHRSDPSLSGSFWNSEIINDRKVFLPTA